jgi:flagellar protein FliT
MKQSRPNLIQYYEEVAQTSSEMVRAAYLGDWFELAALEHRCVDLIDALKDAAQNQSLDEAGRRRRMDLMGVILDNDAQIRVCAEPWLTKLDPFLA